ncbi:MAG: hypothetical protein WA395_12275 [Nitrososphaeraceae archaeon]
MLPIRIRVGGNRRLFESIHVLEDRMGKKISLLSKILLSDTGVLEDKLYIILNSIPSIQVIEQTESNQLISRRAYVIDAKSKRRLVYAISQIHVDSLPSRVIDQIRNKRPGLGRILMDSQMELRKEIVTLGYDCGKQRLFRCYNIYNKKHAAIEVKEVILITDEELKSAAIWE